LAVPVTATLDVVLATAVRVAVAVPVNPEKSKDLAVADAAIQSLDILLKNQDIMSINISVLPAVLCDNVVFIPDSV